MFKVDWVCNNERLQVAEYLSGANERIATFESKLANLHAEKPMEEMTVEEYLSDKPELRAKIEADIASRAL